MFGLLASYTDFKVIPTPFSEVIWKRRVAVSNNFTKRRRDDFKISARDK